MFLWRLTKVIAPKQADGLFELKNAADEPRRIFAVQDGGSKHDELKHSRQLEQLGITARELFDRLSDKLKAGGVRCSQCLLGGGASPSPRYCLAYPAEEHDSAPLALASPLLLGDIGLSMFVPVTYLR